MANLDHIEIVMRGKEVIAKWQEENPRGVLDLSGGDFTKAPFKEANLSDANFHGANLRGANLKEANLRGADLSNCNLRGAILREADLVVADLSGANLRGADLSNCNLGDADLSGANLVGASMGLAHLKDTDLRGADLSDTYYWRTTFSSVDLSTIQGLETTKHHGPSTIGTGTLAITGIITLEIECFLVGCGIEFWEIEIARLYDQALTAEQISEHLTTRVFGKRTQGSLYLGGVFISYAHADREFVDKLDTGLKEQKITTWLDRHDFVAGSLEKNISRAIRINDQVVLVLSKDSLESDWVWDEIATTLEKEKELKKDVLFPIAVDNSWHDDPRNKRRLMRQIKERLILDFSQDDKFDEDLTKLITGMKINQ